MAKKNFAKRIFKAIWAFSRALALLCGMALLALFACFGAFMLFLGGGCL